jgi:hypothetical protein
MVSGSLHAQSYLYSILATGVFVGLTGIPYWPDSASYGYQAFGLSPM